MEKNFFDESECERIVASIKEAERGCSGEIRVHVDDHCEANVLDSAAHTFAKLGMHRTKLRNGVLFYVAADDRKFAVIGDAGINQKVRAGFWDYVVSVLSEHFSKSDFVGGLCEGIRICGEQLKEYFPYQSDDVNELPDDVSFGHNSRR